VFIPTFNESVELLRTTISHVKRMDYPHETYLLDDGNRAEMRVLAEEMGIHYLTRTEHLHAKAGNLNNALKHTQGELIALFDADGVPRRDFLTKLVGYFDEEKVALENTVIYSTQSDGYKILTVVAIGANGIYKLEDGNYVTRDSIQKAECASSSCK